MKKLKLLILSIMIVPFLVGCGGGDNPKPDPEDDDTYTITWVDYDNTVLEVDKYVRKGEMPHYDGKNPSRSTDDLFTYIFNGWDPLVKPATESTTYKANYAKESISDTTLIEISIPIEADNYEFGFFYETDSAIEVEWGDNVNNSESTHTYSYPGQYNIKIKNVTNLSLAKAYGFQVEEYAPGKDYVTEVCLGDSITTIDDFAFNYCSALTDFAVSKNATKIGNYAFDSCTSLVSINIPEGVEVIGENAFQFCPSVANITISENNQVYECKNNTNAIVKKETNSLVYGGKRTTIPDNVTTIGDNAFYYCSPSEILIPEGVTYIGECAFFCCDDLVKVSVPNSIEYIGYNAFETCKNLKYITFGNAKYLGNTGNPYVALISASGYEITDCNINTNCKVIAASAFSSRTKLTSITIPASVISIGENAFEYCDSLTSITIDEANEVYDSRENCNAIIRTETNTLAFGCKATIIPNDVTAIGNYAFYLCCPDEISIPEGVTSIGDYAFYGCKNLTKVSLPNSIEYIGYNAFRLCRKLTYYEYENAKYLGNDSNHYIALIAGESTSITNCTINENSKTIASGAFENCTELTSIIIPNNVSIGDYAFYACAKLTVVNLRECSQPPTLGIYAFHKLTGTEAATFYIANNMLNSYRNAENWKEYDETQFKEENPPINYFFQSSTCSSFFSAV